MKIKGVTTIACLVASIQSSSNYNLKESPEQYFNDNKGHKNLGLSKFKSNIKGFIYGAYKGPTEIFHKLHAKLGLRQTSGSLDLTQEGSNSSNTTDTNSSNTTDTNSDSNNLDSNNSTISNGTMNSNKTSNVSRVYFVSPLYSDAIRTVLVPLDGSLPIVWKIDPKPKVGLKGIDIILENRAASVVLFPVATNLSASTTNFTWDVFQTASNPNLTSPLNAGSSYRLFIFESGTDYLSVNSTRLTPGATKVTIFASPDVSKEYSINSSAFSHSFSSIWLFIFGSLLLLW